MAKRNSNTNELVAALSVALANTYVLAVKTHGYHWNVTGINFPQLHSFFEAQYTGLLAAADELAERIRGLGAAAPASMAQLLELTSIKETGNKPLTAKEMLADLVVAHAVLVADLAVLHQLATQADDIVTEDLLVQRKADHDKTLWMLQAQLN